jgi:hypothetical protein
MIKQRALFKFLIRKILLELLLYIMRHLDDEPLDELSTFLRGGEPGMPRRNYQKMKRRLEHYYKTSGKRFNPFY